MYSAVMIREIGTRSDTDVIHVNSYCGPEWFVFEDDVMIDEVHHRLKSRWGVGETEIHHGRFEKPISGLKGCLVFVSFANTYIVVPPPYVATCVDMRIA